MPEGPLQAGVARVFRFSAGPDAQDVQARLVTQGFQDMAAIPLRIVRDETGEDFVGELVLPTRPVRLVVTGRNAEGLPFQRVHAPLFEPAPRKWNRGLLPAPHSHITLCGPGTSVPAAGRCSALPPGLKSWLQHRSRPATLAIGQNGRDRSGAVGQQLGLIEDGARARIHFGRTLHAPNAGVGEARRPHGAPTRRVAQQGGQVYRERGQPRKSAAGLVVEHGVQGERGQCAATQGRDDAHGRLGDG